MSNYTHKINRTSVIVVNMKFESKIQDGVVFLSMGSVKTDEEFAEFKVWIESTKNTVHALYDKESKVVPIVVDVTNLKTYKPEAFELLAGLLKHDEPYTSKVAIFGGDIFIKAAKDALSAYSGVSTPIESFNTKEEALKWLLSK